MPIPSTSQPTPAAATGMFSATMTTKAIAVKVPPTTAKSGRSTPRNIRLPGPLYGRGKSGSLIRSRTTAACAIVNESRAPNE